MEADLRPPAAVSPFPITSFSVVGTAIVSLAPVVSPGRVWPEVTPELTQPVLIKDMQVQPAQFPHLTTPQGQEYFARLLLLIQCWGERNVAYPFLQPLQI